MLITLIKNNKLNLYNLPEKINGSHWITDFENGRKINLINIEATDNSWKLISNQEAYVIDNQDVMIPYVTLQDYNFYTIKNNYRNEKYFLYCSPIYDKTFKEIGLDDVRTVGSKAGNIIRYNLPGIPDIAYKIDKQDNHYYLTLQDKNALVFINQKKVLMKSRLEYGDVIFMFGLKVIIMQKNGKDYLLVNNPNNLLEMNPLFTNVIPPKVEFQETNEELREDSLFMNQNYFYRTPYFYEALNKFILKIDAPPTRKEEDSTPAVLTIGPMLTMSMISVVMLMSTMKSVNSGERALSDSWTSIIMCIIMLASSLLWPLLTKAYQKFSDKMYERKRQRLYKKYIDSKEDIIRLEMTKQTNSLLENNYSIEECQNIIRAHNVKLWQRRLIDEDFLNIPVGIGNVPMQIEIQYPEEHFSLSEDNLLNIAYDLGKRDRTLKDVPITHNFYQKKITGVIGDSIINKEFIDRVILQMITNYSYDELKLVTFTSKENENNWDYIKTLPHSWSNDHTFRFFGSENEDYREIIYNLEQILNDRLKRTSEERYSPHYVIITDAIKSIDSYDFIKKIMQTEQNVGFSMIMLVDRVSACPNECKNFINVNRDECGIFSSMINKAAQRFKIDFYKIEELYNCAKELANIKIEIKTEIESNLPDVYHFLEMYQVGKVEQLNSLERWKKSNPILSLQVPIGIGKSGEIISLDLHEKYHGPHGLIAGTTGSGKSEFIISYILSLAVNYSPHEVQIILIDYKGGSLAGSFQNGGFNLPHLAGSITNLDGNELNRSLASIESEVKRRQKEFNEARIIANESSIDIYKYQKLYREGRLKEKKQIAHLFIISDEFAELKEQQPEFMEKLISIARVGRSLGVHLILATQKPGGVVDSQIWSNTRFRVCLKVQDTSDSQEVLKKPDAAFLKKTGRFYLQVGYDEVYTLGQSAWSGGQYYPNTSFQKEVDTSINTINNIGFVTQTKDLDIVKKVESQGEELKNIVKYLSVVAKEQNIKIQKLWLEKIPALIYIDELKEKYNFEKENFILNPIIGEYDDPSTQNQYPLTVPFYKEGNAIIYGIAGSGKETFLSSLLYSFITTYKTAEINAYILDFGGETLGVFKNAPQVGDIAYLNDAEKINNLFKMIEETLNERRKLFSEYGGTYDSFIKNSQEKQPSIVILLNNYEAFVENYEDRNETLIQISRESSKYGIYFIITATSENSVRLRMKQNFSLIYVLGQNNETDYSSILGNCHGKVPAKLKGRGLFKKDQIYEFQTAHVSEENLNDYLPKIVATLTNQEPNKATKVPVLPEEVNFEAVKHAITANSNIVVGINKQKLNVEKFNIAKNSINIISSYEIETTIDFLHSLINQLTYINYGDLYIINTTEEDFNNLNMNGKIYTKNFDALIEKIIEYVDKVYEIYEERNFDETVIIRQKKIVCFVLGMYDFINQLNEENKKKLESFFAKNNQMGLVSFMIIDNPDTIKNYTYENWFKTGADTSRGIWIGSGIADETLFKISKFEREDRAEITSEFGYIIHNAKIIKIKLLKNFEPKEQ